MTWIRCSALLVCSLLLARGAAAPPDAELEAALSVPELGTPAQERELIQSLTALQRGRLYNALWRIEHLLEQQPDFRLAHLVRGDVLAAQVGPLRRLGQGTDPHVATELSEEAVARLARYRNAPGFERVPEQLLQVPDGARSALVIDAANYRIFVFERRGDRLERVNDYYVSIGKAGPHKLREGDERTPVGVYTVSSYLPGATLPDLYGEGAFPIDYPNGWDRINGRTGSGIWIHGTESDRYSRPPLSSRGCVTLSNLDFLELRERVEVGRTPVIVSDGLRWIDADEVGTARRGVTAAIEAWRRDWEGLDTDAYLAHYSRDFQSDTMTRRTFADYKRRVNAGKLYVRVELSEVGIYGYPGEQGLVAVDFQQAYESNNFRSRRRKTQYWRNEGDAWRIVYEGS